MALHTRRPWCLKRRGIHIGSGAGFDVPARIVVKVHSPATRCVLGPSEETVLDTLCVHRRRAIPAISGEIVLNPKGRLDLELRA